MKLSFQHRRAAALLILILFASLHAGLCWLTWGERRGFYSLLTAGEVLATVALIRTWFWARLLTQGMAVGNAMSQAVVLTLWQAGSTWPTSEEIGFALVSAAACVVLLILVGGKQMAATYDLKASSLNHWDLDRPSVRLLRLSVMLCIATLPMLTSYICSDGIWMPEDQQALGLGLGALLVTAISLVILQKTVGVLLLLPAGLGTTYISLRAVHELKELLGASLEGICGTGVGMHEMVLVDTAGIVTGLALGAVAAIAAFMVFLGPLINFLRR